MSDIESDYSEDNDHWSDISGDAYSEDYDSDEEHDDYISLKGEFIGEIQLDKKLWEEKKNYYLADAPQCYFREGYIKYSKKRRLIIMDFQHNIIFTLPSRDTERIAADTNNNYMVIIVENIIYIWEKTNKPGEKLQVSVLRVINILNFGLKNIAYDTKICLLHDVFYIIINVKKGGLQARLKFDFVGQLIEINMMNNCQWSLMNYKDSIIMYQFIDSEGDRNGWMIYKNIDDDINKPSLYIALSNIAFTGFKNYPYKCYGRSKVSPLPTHKLPCGPDGIMVKPILKNNNRQIMPAMQSYMSVIYANNEYVYMMGTSENIITIRKFIIPETCLDTE